MFLVLFGIHHLPLSGQTLKLPLSKGGSDDGGTILQVNVDNGNYIVSSLPGLYGTAEQGVQSGTEVNTSTSSVFFRG